MVKICVIRVGGTNCDEETKRALDELGAVCEVIHFKKIVKGKKKLSSYDALIIPGGFSFGDHVRAGAILGKEMKYVLSKELKRFVEEGRPILGICNGFQVLVEADLLPGFGGGIPQAALAINDSARFECRWVYLRVESGGKCIFTRGLKKGEVVSMPVAHAEGKFVFPKGKEEEYLKKLVGGDQLVFRYCNDRGEPARRKYPENPNGSFYDIAGICDPTGMIFGMMPHPERAAFGIQLHNWTEMEDIPEYGDGMSIFRSLMEYLGCGG